MIVVSDTTAISALIQVGQIELLQQLYGEIFIPEAVRDELVRSHSNLPPFLQIGRVANQADVRRLERELDVGEAEAIVLAKELRADLLLVDEKVGRSVAQREGIPIIGVMGVLVVGKHRGLIPSVRQIVLALESKAGFRVSPRVKQLVFAQAGE